VIPILVAIAQAPAAAAPGIAGGALAFMLVSMGLVTLLTVWCFARVIRTKRHFDPDGTGPAKPPVPPSREDRG